MQIYIKWRTFTKHPQWRIPKQEGVKGCLDIFQKKNPDLRKLPRFKFPKSTENLTTAVWLTQQKLVQSSKTMFQTDKSKIFLIIFFNTKAETFFNTNYFRYRIWYFFFFNSKYFRYRIRYFFPYQIFPKPNPILFLIPIFFDTESGNIQKIEKVLKPIPNFTKPCFNLTNPKKL